MIKMSIFFKYLMTLFCSIIISFSLAGAGCTTFFDDSNDSKHDSYIPGQDWTIMIYGDGDNNLEWFLLEDVDEMKNEFTNGQGYNVIVLVDRLGYTSSTDGFDAFFTDTRLYRISAGKATRITGSTQFPEITTSSNYEANMGDAETLQKFIQFCKANYTANHYALILWNHGLGPMKKSVVQTGAIPNKGICVDETSGNDFLYTAEITDFLTSDDYVDLLGFDSCLMGTIEVAYQYRPGTGKFYADIMAASAPSEWGYGWKYDDILKRLNSAGGTNGELNDVSGSGTESIYDPAVMTATNLCDIIVEEQYDSAGTERSDQSMSCYDLSKAAAVKTAVDTLSVSLASYKDETESVRGSGYTPTTMHFFDPASQDEWLQFALFDLYDLSKKINADTGNFPTQTTLANNVMTAVEDMIIYSFCGSDYTDFANGKNGLAIFFPDGDADYSGDPYWARQWWYNAIDTTVGGTYSNQQYGKIAFLMGGTAGDTIVDNWFELLDSWFDTSNGPDGGLNGYQW